MNMNCREKSWHSFCKVESSNANLLLLEHFKKSFDKILYQT